MKKHLDANVCQAVFTGKWKYDKSLGHGDYGLLVSEKAKKHGIAVTLAETTILDPSYGAIVLQYNLRLQKGLECGGAYLKYLQPQVGLLMINQKQFSICSYKCLSTVSKSCGNCNWHAKP
jgi:hypothetical protein